ncbi:MAG: TerC family protein [Planctomycetaceae bacterium]|jgi:tellurite resistance protein TerC|nr:TerC family protein [Planctomycetaceae bacterium]
MGSLYLWFGFIALIIFLLALDLGVFNRKVHTPGIRESLVWTAFWVFLALSFNVGIYFLYENNVFGIAAQTANAAVPMTGAAAAQTFFTGYVIEKSLSLDNIFVISMVFSFFGVPRQYQHRTLFWGIFGALILRGAMILLGTALIIQFHWVLYIFGGLLLLTAAKMLFHQSEEVHPEKNPLVKLTQKFLPMTANFHEEHFFVKENGRWLFTPLMLTLLVVESNDLIFAVDSIPAVFAITQDPFIVFTSNVFAILGLRSLYFVMAAMIAKFKYLHVSLSVILAYVGVKLLCIDVIHHFDVDSEMTLVSLGIIILVMLAGITASLAVKTAAKK